MTETELITALKTETARRIEQAAERFRQARRRTPDIDIVFDLRGTAAGQFVWRKPGRPTIRYNLAIAARHPEHFLQVTVAHEVAHLVTSICQGRVPPHGPDWRAVMREFGIAEPKRCHSYDTQDLSLRRQRTWPYRCTCRRHELSTTRHRRVSEGVQTYVCRRCGEVLVAEPPERPLS